MTYDHSNEQTRAHASTETMTYNHLNERTRAHASTKILAYDHFHHSGLGWNLADSDYNRMMILAGSAIRPDHSQLDFRCLT